MITIDVMNISIFCTSTQHKPYRKRMGNQWLDNSETQATLSTRNKTTTNKANKINNLKKKKPETKKMRNMDHIKNPGVRRLSNGGV